MEEMTMQPPDHLSDRAKDLWRAVVPRRVAHPEELALLQSSLEALDRADQAAAILAEEGVTTKTLGSGTIHVHPAIAIEKESRAAFVKGWNLLNLQWVPSGKSDPKIRDTVKDQLSRNRCSRV